VIALPRVSRFLARFPDAVPRASGAPLIRDRPIRSAYEGPGSAARHFVLRFARTLLLE